MPHTVNGVGTRYFGKKNLLTRPGVCEFCRRETTLSSYDTRLWFAVLFIPVIPLGQKRILNFCPKCTRHRVMSLSDWEKLKEKNLSEAMATMTANPQDAQAAIKAHGALIAFGHTAEADKLMQMMKERFANDAAAQAYLGSILQYLGRYEEFIPYYERALSLDPEMVEAKVAVALNLIKNKRLDDAHKLLLFLEAPDRRDYAGALLAMANGYEDAGRHVEAFRLFSLLLQKFPNLAQDKRFRKAYQRAQTTSGSAAALPPRKMNWAPVMGLGGGIALALIIALGSNYYISQHRTLTLVSGFKTPVTVEIPHQQKITLTDRGFWTLTLPEGSYEAVIGGATNLTTDFSISSGFWARWFSKPAFILNAGGSALLIYEDTTYSQNPGKGEGNISFYYGKPFVTFAQVDYPFVPFPERIQTSSQADAVQKTHIEVDKDNPIDAFMYLANSMHMNDALNLAEWHLRIHPEDTQDLPYYEYFADASGQQQRASAFYAEAIKRRPVELEWHRMYQESRITMAHDNSQVIAEYHDMLQTELTNSALLYLYGRLQTSKKVAMPFYEKAISENPSNYFAHFALAQSYMDFGEWQKALPDMAEANRLYPGYMIFEEQLFQIRMATGDFTGLETDLQAELHKNPLNLQAAGRLCQVYVAEGKSAEADKLLVEVQNTLNRRYTGGDGAALLDDLRAVSFYSAGKFDELEKFIAKGRAPKRRVPDRFAALIELGRLQDAADVLKQHGTNNIDPYGLLVLSIAWKKAGNEEQASSTKTQAIKALASERPESMIAAGWLGGNSAVSPDDVMDLAMTPDRKRIILVALGQSFPQNSTTFFEMARRLNTDRDFPYHLINRLTDSATTASK